jgi:Kdo2-lipid IVA lauroyltransferase/acyltransferase
MDFSKGRISRTAIAVGFRFFGLIPRKTAARIAGVLGRIWFVIDKRHRDVALSNLTQVYGGEKSPAEIRALARRVFQNLVMILFEIGWSLRLKKKEVFKYFHIYGLHQLNAAHKKGRGVLVLTAHIGNWEFLSLVAGMLGYRMSAVYRPFDFAPLDDFFVDLRSRYGIKLFPKASATRSVLRSLKNRELVGILLDQNTSIHRGVFADFLGKMACTNKGLAVLALATGAPVVPVFLIREKDGFRVEFGAEIPLIQTGDRTSDIAANTACYNRVIGSAIRRYPDQWFWVHRRWKTLPYKPWPRQPKVRREKHKKGGKS